MFPGPILALDVGTRTIGVARSDPSRRFVFVDPVLLRRSVAKDVAALALGVRKHRVTLLVVGLAGPEQPGGAPPRTATLARQVGEALASATGLPVEWVDEGYTTVEAHDRLHAAGITTRSRRTLIDGEAARVILEDWLARAAERSEGSSGSSPTPARGGAR